MLTPFGKILRKIRIDRSCTLADIATLTSVTPAFVSALETGRKPVPPTFLEKLGSALDLSTPQRKELLKAAAAQAREVSIPLGQRTDRAKELAVAFARRFETLSAPEIEELFQVIAPEKGAK